MSSVKVVLNSSGVRELLKSDTIMAVCDEYADKALDKLGPGYSKNKYTGKNRVNVQVQADWAQAKAENLRDNTIIKAVLSK